MPDDTEQLKKKIIYRSSYRGTKEMDILLSSFVSEYINILICGCAPAGPIKRTTKRREEGVHEGGTEDDDYACAKKENQNFLNQKSSYNLH